LAELPIVAPAAGARLWAEQAGREPIPMGAEAPAGPTQLRIRLPERAEIDVLRDSTLVHQAREAELDLSLELAGVYRVEARIDGRLWLLSNPIHLRARAARPACGRSASA